MKLFNVLILISFIFLMPLSFSRAQETISTRSATELIDFVNLSPLYVKEHQKEAWIHLFSDDGFIQDPVGGLTFKKPFLMNDFWNAFIQPNDIYFEIKKDTVSDLTIIRDAIVHAKTPELNAEVLTPAHLRYNLKEVDGHLAISSLQAYWNMPTVTKQTLSRGKIGLKIMQKQLQNILAGLGVKNGFRHFLRASTIGVNTIGKNRLIKAISKINTELSQNNTNSSWNPSGLWLLLSKNTLFYLPGQTRFNYAQFIIHQPIKKIFNLHKIISSGNSVATNADFLLENNQTVSGVLIAQFKNLKIQKIEFFYTP